MVGQIVFQACFQQRLGGGEMEVVSLLSDINILQCDATKPILPVSGRTSESDNRFIRVALAEVSCGRDSPAIAEKNNLVLATLNSFRASS